MADKMTMGVLAGSTDLSINFLLRSSSDGTEVTGKAAADLNVSYWRQGGTRTAVTETDLAAVDSAHSDGGVKEVDATNMPGLYRLDLPDAACAVGADWVVVAVKCTGCFTYYERIDLSSVSAAQLTVAGTVDDTAFSPTTAAFEADDITTAAADHWNGRIIVFVGGTLDGQATDILDYALTGGRGHFTVSALTSAPANNQRFRIV